VIYSTISHAMQSLPPADALAIAGVVIMLA
jgi:hypothetical protein